MDNFLEGKRALVTGGTRGIGCAIAQALVAQGAAVAICGRSVDGVAKVVKTLGAESKSKVIGKAADVSNSGEVESLFRWIDQEMDGLDILVNNAGIGIFRSAADLSVEEWRQTLDTNLSGVFYCSREALQRFRNLGAGYIINISSLAGKNPFAGGAAYNASKFGLNGLSEAMMLDHRQAGVRVSYIMPGSVDTEFASGERADWKIAPEDIADVVLMLLRMPTRTLVSRVEVRPAKPRK